MNKWRTLPKSMRGFSSTSSALHGGKGRPAPGTGIKVLFKNSKGETLKEVEANEGDDIVDLSWEHDLDIEAACEKSIACSTCHVIIDAESYDKLPEPTDEENLRNAGHSSGSQDMLDMAFGLEDTSRLGCQCKVTRDLDGMTVQLPSATRNFAVDGHKGKH
ncbi:MAG: hypothetical protein CYPHOPRED_004976 [Cyphobasidiales sp. Tagirdzhanova-0007]|nr:MAG: hypothetical protein CYPHOPRED_004976 [Cyphobasidiales sp. Tagirdzhanova-0007]